MDGTTLLVVLVSLGVVILTSVFKVVELSTKAKQAIALIVSALAGSLTAWQTGQFDNAQDVLATITIIYGLSQGIYQFLFDSGRMLGGLDSVLEDFRVGGGPDLPESDPAHTDDVVADTDEEAAP